MENTTDQTLQDLVGHVRYCLPLILWIMRDFVKALPEQSYCYKSSLRKAEWARDLVGCQEGIGMGGGPDGGRESGVRRCGQRWQAWDTFREEGNEKLEGCVAGAEVSSVARVVFWILPCGSDWMAICLNVTGTDRRRGGVGRKKEVLFRIHWVKISFKGASRQTCVQNVG